jgi:hypothetical protein
MQPGAGDGDGQATAATLRQLQIERERNAELTERVRVLTDENRRKEEMLRRHQERWQR